MSMLADYLTMQSALLEQAKAAPGDSKTTWLLLELHYRIGVLETLQWLYQWAPEDADPAVLLPHYRQLDAFAAVIATERQFVIKDDKALKRAETAQNSYASVLKSYRKAFSSFVPADSGAYRKQIRQTISALCNAWVALRETHVRIYPK